MPFAFLPLAYAQAPVPPPVRAQDACGPLCDLVGPLLWGTPVLAAIVAFGLVLGLHRSRVGARARGWAGEAVAWSSVWLLPIFVGVACMVTAATALLVLAMTNDDFRLLLFMDWKRPGVGLTWVTATLLGVLGAPGLAAARGQ
jgi:hypothetical protein